MACHAEGEDLKSRTRSSRIPRHELSAFRAKLASDLSFASAQTKGLYSRIPRIAIRSRLRNSPPGVQTGIKATFMVLVGDVISATNAYEIQIFDSMHPYNTSH